MIASLGALGKKMGNLLNDSESGGIGKENGNYLWEICELGKHESIFEEIFVPPAYGRYLC